MKHLFTILATLLVGAVYADDLTADQIIEKANLASYYAGKDGRAEVEMTIKEAGGGTRTRRFVILRTDVEDGGDQNFYVYFKEPADVRNMAYLVWKHTAADNSDDRWLWLPKLNLKKRIAPGDKRTSFVGSDFYYEDVSGRGTTADTHELVETTDTQYQVKNVPKDPGEVEFSYYLVWIDKATFLPRRAEYFDKNGKKYRELRSEEVQDVQGYATATRQVARDLNAGSETVNTFTKIEYDLSLPAAYFTERFLRHPPPAVR